MAGETRLNENVENWLFIELGNLKQDLDAKKRDLQQRKDMVVGVEFAIAQIQSRIEFIEWTLAFWRDEIDLDAGRPRDMPAEGRWLRE